MRQVHILISIISAIWGCFKDLLKVIRYQVRLEGKDAKRVLESFVRHCVEDSEEKVEKPPFPWRYPCSLIIEEPNCTIRTDTYGTYREVIPKSLSSI